MKRLITQMTANLERLMTAITFAEADEQKEAMRLLGNVPNKGKRIHVVNRPITKRLVLKEA